MATAKNRCVWLAKAPLTLALVVVSTMLLCACPAREAAPGQDATTTATQLAADGESEGVSLWYEFVVSEIGFMLDENSELPKSLDDWKQRMDPLGIENSVQKDSASEEDTDRAAHVIGGNEDWRYSLDGEPFSESMRVYSLCCNVDILFGRDDSDWLMLSYSVRPKYAAFYSKFEEGHLRSLTQASGSRIERSYDQSQTGSEYVRRNYWALFRGPGLGYAAINYTSLSNPNDRFFNVVIFNLSAMQAKGVAEISGNELYSEWLGRLFQMSVYPDPVYVSAKSEPLEVDACQLFMAGPFSPLTEHYGKFPETRKEWQDALSGFPFPGEGIDLPEGKRNWWEANEEHGYGIKGLSMDYAICAFKIGYLDWMYIYFRDNVESWTIIEYYRSCWRWDEHVLKTDYYRTIFAKLEGLCDESRFNRADEYFPEVEYSGMLYAGLARVGPLGYECALEIYDEKPPIEVSDGFISQHLEPQLTVTIYALDRIGPLTEENVKDAGMLKTLRKLADLPAND